MPPDAASPAPLRPRSRPRPEGSLSAAAAAVVCGLALVLTAVPVVRAQVTVEVPTLVGFKAPITEDNRMVALVAGKEAKPSLLAGQVQITEFRLETYRYAPEREVELVVESPLGTFGPSGASSDRAIALRSSDGRFAIHGVGWSWDRGTGVLTISNRVETSLRQNLKETNRPPIQVSATSFQYQLRTGDARFRGDCVALQPGQARIRAGELFSRLSARATRPDSILATNGVTLEVLRPDQPGTASGTGAVYAAGPDGERITLFGPTTWAFGPATGSADELVLLPATNAYLARGHARLRLADLPRAADAANPAAAAPAADPRPAPAGARPRPPLDITADTIDSQPGRLTFTGPVVATQEGRLELRARQVVAELSDEPGRAAGRDRIRQVTATGDVAATLLGRAEPVRLRGREMVFTGGEHELIEVLGDPSWETAGYVGRAGKFVIHPEVPTFQAVDKVRVQWQPGAGTPAQRPPIQLTADRMTAELGEARFAGNVEARHPRWAVQSGELDLRLGTNNASLRELAARGGVILDYPMPEPKPRAQAPDADAAPPRTPRSGRRLGSGLESGNPTNRLWRVRAGEVTGAPSPDGSGFETLEAKREVRIDNPAAHAVGGRLTYRAQEGLFRLLDDPRLETADGLEILGVPGTVIGYDPVSNRFVVEGPVRRMVLPAGAVRDAASTNRPAGR